MLLPGCYVYISISETKRNEMINRFTSKSACRDTVEASDRPAIHPLSFPER